MPIKRKSAKLSKASSVPNKPAPKRSRVAEDIISGLQEAAAFSRGEISLPVRLFFVPESVDVKKIRAKSGLSQSEFALLYGFNRRTLQNWEQGRIQPESPVRAYLTVIDRAPQAVERALGLKAKAAGR
jgi:putative transcriptional regulator